MCGLKESPPVCSAFQRTFQPLEKSDEEFAASPHTAPLLEGHISATFLFGGAISDDIKDNPNQLVVESNECVAAAGLINKGSKKVKKLFTPK